MPNVRTKAWGETVGNCILSRPYPITGVTRDSASAPLPFCFVHLFHALDDIVYDMGSSDAVGAYTVNAYDLLNYYAVAFKHYSADITYFTADSTLITADVTVLSGVTLDTLVGV